MDKIAIECLGEARDLARMATDRSSRRPGAKPATILENGDMRARGIKFKSSIYNSAIKILKEKDGGYNGIHDMWLEVKRDFKKWQTTIRVKAFNIYASSFNPSINQSMLKVLSMLVSISLGIIFLILVKNVVFVIILYFICFPAWFLISEAFTFHVIKKWESMKCKHCIKYDKINPSCGICNLTEQRVPADGKCFQIHVVN